MKALRECVAVLDATAHRRHRREEVLAFRGAVASAAITVADLLRPLLASLARVA